MNKESKGPSPVTDSSNKSTPSSCVMMIGFIVQVYKYFIRYTYLFMGKTCGYMIITYDITQLMLGRLEWEQVANKYEV